MPKTPVIRMNAQYKRIRPAALSRRILELTGRLETLATAKQPAPVKPPANEQWNYRANRRYSFEATTRCSRSY
ncbi:hypothetical protein J2X01_004150 [Arthrobacter ginsengisoli]|uniref:Uncharacterized protein n=1 Tax=Arthrobacter ginsengisoli TaxID=1356565 RepID=A0ABU1UI50_9MICC|nr:hypothetical protein [Arthrobacter ginsengisoli]